MNNFAYPSEAMQRKLDEAKAYLRRRGKYVIDQGNTWIPSHNVRWDEYKNLVHPMQQAAN